MLHRFLTRTSLIIYNVSFVLREVQPDQGWGRKKTIDIVTMLRSSCEFDSLGTALLAGATRPALTLVPSGSHQISVDEITPFVDHITNVVPAADCAFTIRPYTSRSLRRLITSRWSSLSHADGLAMERATLRQHEEERFEQV